MVRCLLIGVDPLANPVIFYEVKWQRAADEGDVVYGRYGPTYNFHIEIKCSGKPSGICTTTSDFYVFATFKHGIGIVVYDSYRLARLFMYYYWLGGIDCRGGGDKQRTEGIKIPSEEAARVVTDADLLRVYQRRQEIDPEGLIPPHCVRVPLHAVYLRIKRLAEL